ncbi:MAG: UvrD-helicase domain-containing protein [Myxococcota bacterium]
MVDHHLEEMLATKRGFVVAAAGCGKTQLLARIVADPRSGRQLVLTHTHAGVAAVKRRLEEMKVPAEKYAIATLDGFGLRYGVPYPLISGLRHDEGLVPDWAVVAPGATEVVRSAVGRAVLEASYDGALVDEYQDCRVSQHELVRAIAEVLPCRAVGDPLQAVFGFREEQSVSLAEIEATFERQSDMREPWRWRRPGSNAALGDWLITARDELERYGRLTVPEDAPVRWVSLTGARDQREANACHAARVGRDTIAAIMQWPRECIALAKRLGGRWSVVERFDEADLPALGALMAIADGPSIVRALHEFLAERVTGVGPALERMVAAIAAQRPRRTFKVHLDHLARLEAIARQPSPDTICDALEAILGEKDWYLYRPENVMQLRSALRESRGQTRSDLPAAVAAARVRARHVGRRTYGRSVGTPLLVKGLEFDHAVVLRPESLTREGLYVAITRGSKSLTLVSASRVIIPRTEGEVQ